MAKSKADTLREERTDKVLTMATDEAKSVHGNAAAKAVTVTGGLNVSVTEGDTTTADGAEATVTLKTTHSEVKEPKSKSK
ncbi:MAG: hypothetical protein KC777_02405 [Cyanobacteria bacterium HKST-UBA02]|nr:hypothetical protein [Candidatus Melainabacteria bacterium]MCA9800805.1 hypothetical protein [Cyanobacteria bacterium HKST-UBA02]